MKKALFYIFAERNNRKTINMRNPLMFILAFLLFACSSNEHLIKDSNRLAKIEKDFALRKAKVPNQFVWDVFNKKMTTQEKEAMMFLYAYMPLNDLVDYDGDFYLRNIKFALKTRSEFSWGAKVPETEFLHFVLPHRINNENLDSSRVVFFKELKNRIKNLSMHKAALEVNHWCHEKVTYKGASIRTSAPLATVKSAIGRCGEESTFTVQALRSVGIPARQVYTPRWAHSDDNHAWVEVYIDGKWNFLGACEPTADLNQGWFTEPTRRAMLIHTKAFGSYYGSEKILKRKHFYTELNTLPTYAITKEVKVKVLDENGKAKEGADVHFKLYNYSELYPITTKLTDKNGECKFLTGLGDLLIWATDGNKFGFKKMTVTENSELTVKIDKTSLNGESFDIDLVAPVEKAPLKGSSKGAEENNRRLKEEDAIRKQYENTFMTKAQAEELAKKVGLDKESIVNFIKKSRGNHATIKKFIIEGVKFKKEFVVDYLNNISDKDLRDAPYDVIWSDFTHSFKFKSEKGELYNQYVLRPRIRNEFLTNYKEVFQKAFSDKDIKDFKANPHLLVKYVKENIKIDEEGMFYSLPMLPTGVHKLKLTNVESRDVYFIALCRAFGIPARHHLWKIPQYYTNKWIDAKFDNKSNKVSKKATVTFKFNKNGRDLDPKYFIDFTLAKLENGVYKSLEFDWNVSYSKFDKNIPIDAGSYMMVTGNRMNDGSVLTKLSFFEIKEGEHKNLKIEIRESRASNKVLGKIDLNKTLKSYKGERLKLSSLPNKKGLVAVWLDPDREPTKHLFQDLSRLKDSFEKRNYSVLAVTPKHLVTASFKPEKYHTTKNIKYVITEDNETLKKAFKSMKKDITTVKYPVVLCINPNNEIILLSQGYKIGLGEMIIKTLK
jgi:hypothetical protein